MRTLAAWLVGLTIALASQHARAQSLLDARVELEPLITVQASAGLDADGVANGLRLMLPELRRLYVRRLVPVPSAGGRITIELAIHEPGRGPTVIIDDTAGDPVLTTHVLQLAARATQLPASTSAVLRATFVFSLVSPPEPPFDRASFERLARCWDTWARRPAPRCHRGRPCVPPLPDEGDDILAECVAREHAPPPSGATLPSALAYGAAPAVTRPVGRAIARCLRDRASRATPIDMLACSTLAILPTLTTDEVGETPAAHVFVHLDSSGVAATELTRELIAALTPALEACRDESRTDGAYVITIRSGTTSAARVPIGATSPALACVETQLRGVAIAHHPPARAILVHVVLDPAAPLP